MSGTSRTARTAKTAQTSPSSTSQPPANALPSPITFIPPSSSTLQNPIAILSSGSKLPNLKSSELTLLRKKQRQLSSTASSTLSLLPNPGHLNALLSTLIFAQHEAGTAVCINSSGWVLTCAHCFGDDEEEYRECEKRRWLLYYTGQAVLVECRAWDPRRDLALLKIIAIEISAPVASSSLPVFNNLEISKVTPKYRLQITCIGQPGRDDLEAAGNKKTMYNLIEISEGRLKGMVKAQDPQENGEIGSMMHDCWTYWGHSGAPLVDAEQGSLVGLHSSWDDMTAMRHGIPSIAIKEFLKEHSDMIGEHSESFGAGTSDNPIELA